MLNRKLKQRINSYKYRIDLVEDINSKLQIEAKRLKGVVKHLEKRIESLEHPFKYDVGFVFIKDGLDCIITECIRYKGIEETNLSTKIIESNEYEYFNGTKKDIIYESEIDKLINK